MFTFSFCDAYLAFYREDSPVRPSLFLVDFFVFVSCQLFLCFEFCAFFFQTHHLMYLPLPGEDPEYCCRYLFSSFILHAFASTHEMVAIIARESRREREPDRDLDSRPRFSGLRGRAWPRLKLTGHPRIGYPINELRGRFRLAHVLPG